MVSEVKGTTGQLVLTEEEDGSDPLVMATELVVIEAEEIVFDGVLDAVLDILMGLVEDSFDLCGGAIGVDDVWDEGLDDFKVLSIHFAEEV